MKTLKLITIFSISMLIAFGNNTNAQDLGGNSYTTAIGLRAGFTSGVTLKHFIKSNSAIEGIIGTNVIWRGFSIAGLYELHIGNAFDVPELTWEFGGGLRIGSYRGGWYYRNCNNPWDPDCNGNYDRSVLVIGILGIGGLEYQFKEVPITIGLDLMPYIDFVGWGGGFIDGSLSGRYIIQ